MARYSIFDFSGRLLVVVGDGFGVRRCSMTAVACGAVRWYAAVRLFSSLVVVRQAAKEDEKTEMAIYSIFDIRLCFFLSKGT
jgi:hypothetical protein